MDSQEEGKLPKGGTEEVSANAAPVTPGKSGSKLIGAELQTGAQLFWVESAGGRILGPPTDWRICPAFAAQSFWGPGPRS
jgi:hypothetical protein